MAIQDASRVYDGMANSFAGGQDAGKRGSLIAADQCQEMENTICRDGNVKTRPAFRKLTFDLQNSITYDAQGDLDLVSAGDSDSVFLNGLFQGAAYYDPSLGEDCFVASIGGRLFKLVPARVDVDVTELPLDKQNRGTIPIAYMVQADRYLIIQDGESTALIYDGVTARRAGNDEVPVGTIMAYGMGRLVLVTTNMRELIFGDLIGSHAGDPSASILKFTETNFLSEGGSASVPFSMGHITGAIFYPQQDTTMGQGELLVFAEKGMASFFLSLPREQWKTSQFQRLGLIEIGGRGHRAFTPVNGDIWFRAGDGWRAYRQARAEARGWSQLPLSTGVGNFVDKETESMLNLGSSILHNNRLIVTSTPIPNQGRPYHNGLLALDFNVLSTFGQARQPSWDGHWSGIKVTQLVSGNFNGNHRAFAFGIDEDGKNALYEIIDEDEQDTSGPITSWIIPRTFSFSEPYNETKIYDCDLWFESVRESTTLTAYYKPDRYPNWLEWRTTPVSDLQPIDEIGTLAGIPITGAGFKPRRSLGKPQSQPDRFSTSRDTKRVYELDMKLQWTGYLGINRMRLHDKSTSERYTAKV